VDKEALINLLKKQIKILEELNNDRGLEPEQVRKNAETILNISTYVYSLDRKINP